MDVDKELDWYFGAAESECAQAHAIALLASYEIPDGPRAERVLRGYEASRSRARGIYLQLCRTAPEYACVIGHAYEPRKFDPTTLDRMGNKPAVTARLVSTRAAFAADEELHACPGNHPSKRGIYGFCASLPQRDGLVGVIRRASHIMLTDAHRAYTEAAR